MDRKPIAAGKFYPGTQTQLEKTCEALVGKFGELEDRSSFGELTKPIGVIVPHAGYVYSGKTAGMAIRKALEYGRPQNIVIFGPNHTGYGQSVSVWSSGTWHVPNGDVVVNEQLANALIDEKWVYADETAHLYEHSIEVQLPILLYAFEKFQFVPVCMMDQRLSTVKAIVEKMKKILEVYPSTLVVASSDFNHYDSHEKTLEKDEIAIRCILDGDLEGLYDSLKKYDITMCGPAPVSIVRSLFDNIELVNHTTSAEFSQDYSYTVGYASFVLH